MIKLDALLGERFRITTRSFSDTGTVVGYWLASPAIIPMVVLALDEPRKAAVGTHGQLFDSVPLVDLAELKEGAND